MQPPSTARSRLRRRLARLAAVCLAAAAMWACGPVYIPVPPPDTATFSSEIVTDAAGAQRRLWTASGPPNSNAADALFYIFDSARDAGVIARARADGSYTSPTLEGTEGDQILIYYQDELGRASPSACVILSERRPSAELCR